MLHRPEVKEEEEEDDRTSDLTILAHDTVYLEHLKHLERVIVVYVHAQRSV